MLVIKPFQKHRANNAASKKWWILKKNIVLLPKIECEWIMKTILILQIWHTEIWCIFFLRRDLGTSCSACYLRKANDLWAVLRQATKMTLLLFWPVLIPVKRQLFRMSLACSLQISTTTRKCSFATKLRLMFLSFDKCGLSTECSSDDKQIQKTVENIHKSQKRIVQT